MDSITISKVKPPHKSMDYNFLREEGLRHIEKLAGSLWTDYNSHDPGITLLEVLCYAITDLGYRTNFPIEDLLASSSEQTGGRDFFRIPEILPCNPVTLTDLRKLIIGYQDIRNAWVEKLGKNDSGFRGLYNVTLELEDHHLLGDLNFIVIKSAIRLGKRKKDKNWTTYTFDIAFSGLNDLLLAEHNKHINHVAINTNSAGEDMFIRIEEDLVSHERFNDYYVELILNNNKDLVTSLLIKFDETFDLEDHEFQEKLMEELLLKKFMEELLEIVLKRFPEDKPLEEIFNKELLSEFFETLPKKLQEEKHITFPDEELLKEELIERLPQKILKVLLVDLLKEESLNKKLLQEIQEKLRREETRLHTLHRQLLNELRTALELKGLLDGEALLKDIRSFAEETRLRKLQAKLLEEMLGEMHEELLEELLEKLQEAPPAEGESFEQGIAEGKSPEILILENQLEERKRLEKLLEKLLKAIQKTEFYEEIPLERMVEKLLDEVNDHELKEGSLPDRLRKAVQKKFREKKENQLKKHIAEILLSTGNKHINKGPVVAYWDRVQEAHSVIKPVINLLHSHRPLCEDFNSVKTLQVQEISITADIDIATNASTEEVMAQIYYQVHNFLLPRPRFYTLQTLLKEGKGIEEIFEGPLLQKGFLDTKELETPVKREMIYTSDIQQILTNIPGLVAVRNLRLTNYLNNNALIRNAVNCLGLYEPKKYKPLLSADKSRISFYKDWRPVSVDQSIAIKKFNTLKVRLQPKKTATAHILNPPRGKNREVENYYSIQHHFPPAYGMGSEKLPPPVPASREAKILQLKSYLLFFEQLLANYFAQLVNLRSLFSMEADIKNTYFSQSLIKSVPEAARLLNGENYEAQLSDITEPPGENKEEPGVFHKRRNRFLDHLMGRFCESFNDYALFLYTTTENKKIAGEELIDNKAAFLREYPELSHDRARAFNYLAQQPDETNLEVSVADVWNTNNVSGIKKNIVRRLGLKSYERKHLYGEKSLGYYFTIQQNQETKKYHFELNHKIKIPKNKNKNNTVDNEKPCITLQSVKKDYITMAEAEAEAIKIAILATQKNQYQLTGSKDNRVLSYKLTDEEGTVIAQPEEAVVFKTEEGRNTCIQEMIDFLSIQGNLHVVEHLLLRPVTETEKMHRLLPETTLTDPYSFRISIILPLQHKKLGNPEFRGYAEKVIHSETPAHIVPHIYWVDIERMHSFELCYKDWLEKCASLKPDAPELTVARNKLVRVLNDIDKS